MKTAFAFALAAASLCASAAAPTKQVERGRYLVTTIGGCNDCHTPKTFSPQGPQLDASRLLSGHPSTQPLPSLPGGMLGPDKWGAVTTNDLTAWVGPWGTSFAANLTPDATGLGQWTDKDFIRAMRTGKHLGVGRPILPPMPWQEIGNMTDADLRAIFAYLKSLPPVANQVPAPLPPR
jgi:mono/diheme cytochrome c family protein